MRRNKTFIYALTVALAAGCFVLSGCDFSIKPTTVEEAKQAQAANISPKVSTPAIKEDGQLIIGLKSMTNAAPMCETDRQGNLFGIDVDVASAIADNLGLKVKFVPATNNDDIDESNYDIVMDVKAKDNKDVTVVGHYADTGYAFFHKGEEATLSVSDLDGKTVGLQTGCASQSIISKTNLTMTEKGFANLNEAFEALNAGSVDFVLCEVYRGAYCASLYTDIALAGTLDVPEAIGVGVSSSNPALQQAVQGALDEMSTNGVLALIKSHWIGGVSDLSVENQIQGIEKNEDVQATEEEVSEEAPVTAGSNAATVD